MRQLHLIIALSMVAFLAVGTIAIGRGIRPEGNFSYIEITKTYDIYGIPYTSKPCQEKGKCLGTIDASACLTLCGIQFDIADTEYWVFNVPEGVEPFDAIYDPANLLGWSFFGDTQVACISKDSLYGRVRYHLLIYAKNYSRTPSKLVDATLCLAVETTVKDIDYVGADYQQVDEVYGGEAKTEIILPAPDNEEIGENVILCPIERLP
jgi:hypothetical protein